MDAFIRFTQQHMPLLLAMIFHFIEGMSITAIQGENKVIQWTMDPVPPSDVAVSVLHPSGDVVFTALGTIVIPGASDIGKRVSNTDNTNTNTGNIEFTLISIRVQDAGDYKAGYYPGGSIGIREVGVTLFVYVKPSKPVITKTDGTNVVKSTLVLNCSATSHSKPDGHSLQMNYTWYKNGDDLPVEERYVTSGSNLQVKNIQRTDKDTVFTCRAYETTSLPSDVSDGYAVNVKYGPNVVLPNITRQHIVTENAVIIGPICSADCEPACTYQWVFDGVDFGSPGNTLTINNIQRTSTGTYWCVASNAYGTGLSNNVTVTVQYAPDTTVLTSSAETAVTENTPLSITCSTHGVPLPNITIKSVEQNGKHYVTQSSTNYTVTIQRADCRDTGRYICLAENEIGKSSSNETNINVTCLPKQKTELNRTHAILLDTGENLNMTVTLISNPLATVYWSFSQTGKTNKQRLVNNTNDFLVVNDNSNVWIQSTATRNSMRLEYFGEYTLHASNPLGSTDVSFNVSPKSGLQPPVQIRADCRSSRMAELLLLADNDLNVTIDILTSTNGEYFTDVKSEIDYTKYPVIISNVYGLEPETLYYFKVFSNSVFGKTESLKYPSCLTPDEKNNTEQSAEVKSMFYAGAAMLAIGLILIILVPIITVILLRRNRPSTNSTSQRYEDIGANLPPQDKSPDKDYQEMEPISSVYQELGPQGVPTVYEKLGTKNEKGWNESQYMDITNT